MSSYGDCPCGDGLGDLDKGGLCDKCIAAEEIFQKEAAQAFKDVTALRLQLVTMTRLASDAIDVVEAGDKKNELIRRILVATK